jgi:hypothetical protein
MKRMVLALAASALLVVPAANGSAQAIAGSCTSGASGGLAVIGLTADQRLICFSENEPGAALEIGAVSGLMGGETLVGIDFRPSDGRLYGLGSAGGVYVIDAASAAATRQSVLVGAMDMMPVALEGASFGVDFNPVPDRLRITSDTGQNLRVNVDDGTTSVDAALNPAPGTGITGAAYTNNDADPDTLTVLYDMDTMADQLSIQSPPNAGSLAGVGKLQVDAASDVGFDIFSQVADGTTEGLVALASLTVDGRSSLFGMDLTTGRAAPRGAFAMQNQVIGIAIPLDQRMDIPPTDDEEPGFIIGPGVGAEMGSSGNVDPEPGFVFGAGVGGNGGSSSGGEVEPDEPRGGLLGRLLQLSRAERIQLLRQLLGQTGD